MNIETYIVCHKPSKIPDMNGYIPIQVGSGEDLGYVRDNKGDNISKKNAGYSELTAAYWIWKNSQAEVVGLNHYRRFFFNSFYSSSFKEIITKSQIEELMSEYDIIIPVREYSIFTVEKIYAINHNYDDYLKCREVVIKKYPEYIDSFDYVSKSHSLVTCNMMITKKEIFDEYHQWLFDILFELEQQIDTSEYDKYNKRIFGFISERLFTVWLRYNSHLKIKSLPMFSTEGNAIIYTLTNNLKKFLVKLAGKPL